MTSTSRRGKADRVRIGLDAQKIRDLREQLGLTQDKAAKLAGLSRAQVWSDIENGRRANLTIETLERIAAALRVKARDLLK
jgi:transcriptional regulator with XRE-family HTH domain